MTAAPPLFADTTTDSTLTDAMRYTYLGDKHTDNGLAGMRCNPVRRPDGKCVVSMKMATALVIDERGCLHVVARRRLRVTSP